MKVEQVIKKIERAAKKETAELRFVRTCQEGDEIRQGDIYLYPVEVSAPLSKKLATKQLAPGTTQGSRHIVEGNVELFDAKMRDPLVGPIVVAKERFTVTHPEHAHISLPSGTYECRYQQDFEAEEIRRVAD